MEQVRLASPRGLCVAAWASSQHGGYVQAQASHKNKEEMHRRFMTPL